ncbi:hypothetical protein HUJ05_005273 [Dendroctonus ponderosae]|nr:hypothetical protein HUJ05_005273 [Dendroctonus ponderosae]
MLLGCLRGGCRYNHLAGSIASNRTIFHVKIENQSRSCHHHGLKMTMPDSSKVDFTKTLAEAVNLLQSKYNVLESKMAIMAAQLNEEREARIVVQNILKEQLASRSSIQLDTPFKLSRGTQSIAQELTIFLAPNNSFHIGTSIFEKKNPQQVTLLIMMLRLKVQLPSCLKYLKRTQIKCTRKGIFVFKPKKKPQHTTLDELFSENRWYQTYISLWTRLNQDFEDLTESMFTSMTSDLLNFVKTSHQNDVTEIPTAALLTVSWHKNKQNFLVSRLNHSKPKMQSAYLTGKVWEPLL